jgi:Zn-finger nucleic acid-binding protein
METELFCPRCNLPLKQVRMPNRLFWACDTCGGRAVGLELLRRTFTPESINPLWLHAIKGEGKIGCRCPSCAHAMIQVALSENAGINVDVCRLCHFVWFDMHEVEALVSRPLPSTPAEMPQAAREAIAMLKVQELGEQARGTDFDSASPDEQWKQIAAFLGMPD